MLQRSGADGLSWSASAPDLPHLRSLDLEVDAGELKATDDVREYCVSLGCGLGGEALGLELGGEDLSASDAGLTVAAVRGGLVARHNHTSPHLQVRPGDQLVEVNGYRIPWLMRSQLLSAQGVLRLSLRREASVSAPPGSDRREPVEPAAPKTSATPPVQEMQLVDSEIQKIHSAVRWGKSTAEIEAVIAECGGSMERALASHDPKNGNLVLHIAAQNNHADLTRYLLKKKANINAQNGKGQTALHMAVEYDMYDLTKMLLQEFGASRDIANGDGHAAITGIDGGKVGGEAWDAPLNLMAAGSTKADLDAALTKLEGWPDKAGTLDKAKLIQTGMANKKRVGAGWDHARFMAVMRTF